VVSKFVIGSILPFGSAKDCLLLITVEYLLFCFISLFEVTGVRLPDSRKLILKRAKLFVDFSTYTIVSESESPRIVEIYLTF